MSCCCCFFFFLLLDSNWNIGSSLGLQPAGIWTGTYTVIYPESPVGPLQTLDHVGQLLITDLALSLSLYISMYTYNNIHSAHAQSLSCVQLFVTPCTVAHQASLPMGFSRQEYWSGLLWPLSGDLPNSGIEPISPSSPALAGKLPLSHLISHNNLQATVLCLVTQLCPILCYPMDLAHQAPLSMGILQARMLEWVAMPSSRGSSQPRDQTQVSCIAGRFFTIWATREAYEYWSE